MKKLLIIIFFVISSYIWAGIPEELKGIWSSDDRIIFLGGENQISIILKEYYGWYYDRAVEPEEFNKLSERKRNLSTGKLAHEYTVNFKNINEHEHAWEMCISIDKKTKSIIPLTLLNNEIYLNFLIKVPYDTEQELDTLEETNENPFFGYWQGLNCNNSIRICQRNNIDNLISWYITENGIYHLRFWPTKMEYEESKAVFSDSNKLFIINKHIFSADQNYTCVNGRSSNIRNVEKYAIFPHDYKISDDGLIMTLGKAYLKKVEDKNSAEDLIKIIKDANSRRKPDYPPLFPESELNWHWDLINQLESGNKIIQEVRERQRNFH